MIRFNTKAIICALLMVLVMGSAAVGFSQGVTGTILGRVTDTSGAVVPGAMVQAQNAATGFSQTAQSDSEGRYSLGSLPSGSYTITVQQSGFRSEVRSGIVLTVASEVTLNVQLSVGNVQEKVEVTAEAPQVETTNATLSGLVSQDQVRDLPLNGRSVDQLALLSPGVFQNKNTFSNPAVGSGIRISVNGARPDSMLYLLDGSATNDASNNGEGSAAGQTLGVEGILEFRLLTHNYSAEYGRFAGAVFSAVTRSGTNELHGSAYEFLRNNDISARNFFTRGSLPAFRRNQFGASAGGRVVKDRVFFFANYEALRQVQGVPVIATVPNANARLGILPTGNVTVNPVMQPYLALYPLPNVGDNGDGTGQYNQNFKSPTTEDYAMERMDFRLSDKDSFFWRYVYDPSAATSPLTVPTFSNTVRTVNHMLIFSETHVFSGASINEFRASMNRNTDFQFSASPPGTDPSLDFVPGTQFGTISFSAASQSAGTLTTLGASMGSGTGNVQNLFEGSDTFSKVRGAHSLKFGVDLVREDLNETYNSNALGNYTFGGLTGLLAGTATQVRFLETNSTSFNERGWRRIVFGAFVQDDYHVRPNLTLNLGLREEFITNPTEVNGRMAYSPGVSAPSDIFGSPFTTPKLNLSPRIGIAWDPTGSGKTSIRVGAGIFYNHLEGRNWYQNATVTPLYLISVSQANPPFPNALALGIPLTAQQNYTVQYHTQTPTVDQYNFEIQRQLTPKLTLRVGYVGSHGYHLSRSAEENIATPQVLAGGVDFFPAGAPRLNPNFSNMATIFTDGLANYNAMQVVLQKTFSAGLTFQVSYTYGKTMSNADETVAGQANSTPSGTMDPYNLTRDYSLSAYDQRNLFVANYAYQMPWDKHLSGRLEKAVLGGWQINGIYTWDTGLPMTVLDGFNRSQNGDSTSTDDRPDLTPGFNNNPINGTTAGCQGILAGQPLQTATRWYDPCAFSLQAPGTYGNLGRNTVTSPGVWNVDFTLVKITPVTERVKLEFRAEVFNLLNHANFGLPVMSAFSSNGTRSGSGGIITTTNIDNRELQFGLKLTF